MASRFFQALAVLTPLATCTSAIAQQPQYTNPPPPPSYSQPAGYPPPPASYPPPPASYPPPPASYPPPPASYQTPAPSYPQQRSYQPPPATYPAAPTYTPQQPAPYQAPPPASYQTQQPPNNYQSPPAGYPPQQSYPAQQTYPPQQQLPYQAPSGYRPQQPAYPPPAGYQSPASEYPPQQSGYTQSSSGYRPQSYPQPRSYQPAFEPSPGYPAQPASYPVPASSAPYESPPAGYPPQQPPGYAAQPPGYQGEVLQASTQFSPYHTHLDVRYGHDRVYPDRGAIVRDAPRGALTVDYAGLAYRFSDGIWLEPRGPAFVVVTPPIGLVVPALPRSATVVTSNGENYLYANDTYYQARPDLKGYEVVNDPLDTTPVSASSQPMPPVAEAPPAEPSDARVAPAPMATARPIPAAAVPLSLAVASSGSHVTSAPSSGGAAASEPPASESPDSEPPAVTSLQISPKNGQTPPEQARDRDECYRFAVLQSHFDPVHPDNTIPAAEIARRQSGFQRAAAACFEGRGYAVR